MSIFLLVVAFAIVFVLSTSQFMPDIVGSHFGLAGHADSLMPRGFYIRFMLSLLLGLPLLLVVIPNLFLSSSTARINLPNRDYWLAPEQRADTIAFLRNHNLRLGSILILFFCYVHWLVVQVYRWAGYVYSSQPYLDGGTFSALPQTFLTTDDFYALQTESLLHNLLSSKTIATQ